MNKKFIRIVALILVMILSLNLVACDFNLDDLFGDGTTDDGTGDGSSDKDNWWNDIEDWFDNTVNNAKDWLDSTSADVKSWWDDTAPTLENFWDNAVDDMKDWAKEAKKLGVEIGDFINDKFDEISQELVKSSNKVKDDIVTGLAQSIYDNARATTGGISASSRTFSPLDLSVFDENNPEILGDQYAYDPDTFVYGLIKAMMPAKADCFGAAVFDSEGNDYYGLAYTDYSKAYVDDQGKTYYPAGFISLVGELPVPHSELDAVLEITRLDGVDEEDTSFVYAYTPGAFTTHCVALGKYFVFGIDDDSTIFYSMSDYTGAACANASLGELYSFDENKVVAFEGHESYFTSSAFMEKIKYETRSLEEIKSSLYQDYETMKIDLANEFSSIDINQIFDIVKTRLKSLFEEMHLSASKIGSLTLNDIFDTNIFNSTETIPAEQKEKTIVMISCITVSVLTIVVQFIPQLKPLKPLMGAIQGTAMEILTEVCMEASSLSTLDYRKIALAAVAGAISVNTGIVGDSLIGGVTEAVMGAMDGENLQNIVLIFFDGCLRGIAFSLAFTGLGKVVGKVVDNIAPNLTKNVANFTSKNQITIGGKEARAATDALTDSADYCVRKSAKKMNLELDDFKEKYAKKAFDQMPRVTNEAFKYMDVDGVVIKQKVLNGYIGITDDASEIVRKSSVNPFTGEQVNKFPVKNAQLDLHEISASTQKVDNFSLNRYTKNAEATGEVANMLKADTKTAGQWGANPETIPEVFKNELKKMHPEWTSDGDFIRLKADDIKKARKTLKWTWHEFGLDGTMMLVPSAVHSKIGHVGAWATLKLLQTYNSPQLTQYVCKYILQ